MEEFGLTVILKLLQGLQQPIRFEHTVSMRVGTLIKSKDVLVLLGITSGYCYSMLRYAIIILESIVFREISPETSF